MSTNWRSSYFSLCLATVCLIGGAAAAAQANGDYDRAVAEFRAGQYSAAEALFARVEASSPGATDALVYRAKCLVHWSDFKSAEQALRGYVESRHDSADALYMLGFVLNRENRPRESLAVYTRAAALTRPTSDDLKIVGLDYVLLDDYPDAIHWLAKAVAFDDKNKDAWYYLGRAYYSKARLGEARQAFEKVLELDPRNSKAENNLGLILETEGQPARAIDAYRKAIGWQVENREQSEQPYVNLGNLLAEQGHIEEAILPLEKAVALAPSNAYCHMILGVYYRKLGEFKNAEPQLEKAAELEPTNPRAHYQLGRLYKDMNELDRAKREFDRTAELESRASKPTALNP